MDSFDQLIAIARRKNRIDHGHSWSTGSDTYFCELEKELAEVRAELPQARVCFLEDELGDVLWDHINAVLALEQEKGVRLEEVLGRARRKFDERISGIEDGVPWDEVKARQKAELSAEQAARRSP